MKVFLCYKDRYGFFSTGGRRSAEKSGKVEKWKGETQEIVLGTGEHRSAEKSEKVKKWKGETQEIVLGESIFMLEG